jgi:tetratricopeptide (TPR) repeat protein
MRKRYIFVAIGLISAWNFSAAQAPHTPAVVASPESSLLPSPTPSEVPSSLTAITLGTPLEAVAQELQALRIEVIRLREKVDSISGTTSSGSRPSLTPTAPNTSLDALPPDLRNEIIRLREKVDSVSGTTSLLITILAAVLALGGVTSLFSWARLEFSRFKRPGEKMAEDRSTELHTLAVRGETAAQARSDEVHHTFLDGSKKTLELVNDTLSLAKEASERAAKSLEMRAAHLSETLDTKAQHLLTSVPPEDDHALVADPTHTASVRSLAQEIEEFHINTLMLADAFRLSPSCMFIRGMNFHLNQQYEYAVKAWQDVTKTQKDTPARLSSLAWYWIGYEYNNLGEFDQACQSFGRALDGATGARSLELQRIEIESRFFNNKESSDRLISMLERLITTKYEGNEEALEAVRRRIQATIGNIYLSTANELRMKSEVIQSGEQYRKAKEHYILAEDAKWALLGLAEAYYGLKDSRAQRIFKEEVRPGAVDEELKRIEPRTKVLARTAELICCIRVKELWDEVPRVHSQVTEALGRVVEGLTVYSQMQRRNVKKDQFRKDLENLMSEFKKEQEAI